MEAKTVVHIRYQTNVENVSNDKEGVAIEKPI